MTKGEREEISQYLTELRFVLATVICDLPKQTKARGFTVRKTPNDVNEKLTRLKELAEKIKNV